MNTERYITLKSSLLADFCDELMKKYYRLAGVCRWRIVYLTLEVAWILPSMVQILRGL